MPYSVWAGLCVYVHMYVANKVFTCNFVAGYISFKDRGNFFIYSMLMCLFHYSSIISVITVLHLILTQ